MSDEGDKKKIDYRLLYGVWQKYGFKPEEGEEFEVKTPPKPPRVNELPQTIEYLLSLLYEH